MHIIFKLIEKLFQYLYFIYICPYFTHSYVCPRASQYRRDRLPPERALSALFYLLVYQSVPVPESLSVSFPCSHSRWSIVPDTCQTAAGCFLRQSINSGGIIMCRSAYLAARCACFISRIFLMISTRTFFAAPYMIVFLKDQCPCSSSQMGIKKRFHSGLFSFSPSAAGAFRKAAKPQSVG